MEPADAVLPDPALVVLVGPSASGKSFWAAHRYRPDEVVSSDRLRALVGSGEHDLEASADAFAVLDLIVAARLRRGLTAVVDTLGLDPVRRRPSIRRARGWRPAGSGSGRSRWAWCCSCRGLTGIAIRAARRTGWLRWPAPPRRRACRASR